MLTKASMNEVYHNDKLVSKFGRMQSLTLLKNGEKVQMKTWANQILDEMLFLVDESENQDHKDIINSAKIKFNNPEQTLSARILDKLRTRNISHEELGTNLGEIYKAEYLAKDKSENKIWQTLEEETKSSINKQKEMEKATKDSEVSFDEYKLRY